MDVEIDADANIARAERIWAEFLALAGELPAPVRVHFLLRLLSMASDAEIAHWMDRDAGDCQGANGRAPRDFRAVKQASSDDGGHA